ncbi:Mre11p [Malassezia vespertilionis]|uniref:Double-strand break repair protein n=2 Tax=Malassezia vespertilionis TaxID=2020962 RepID=A0A2N1JH91_9BASI|nr:Mre11p [Malassezia vespertilionis]
MSGEERTELDESIRFLLASDLHLGYLERDPVRGQDSIHTFREILELAYARNVDFILLGGDVFHENKPSRTTMFQTMSLLREYTFGDKPIPIELLSDPYGDQVKGVSFPAVNYEDANLNVSIPLFSIHGNHDDPQGTSADGPLSALDIPAAGGLLNYFGRIDLPSRDGSQQKRKADDGDDNLMKLKPILLRKGDTRLAMYGIGNIKDERLSYELKSKHVCMYRPSEDPDAWFNILVVHQNRASHTPRAHIPESAFDDAVNLVVWGHEHEQRIMPERVAEKNYYISQPGSTIATSLTPGETGDKCAAIVHVSRKDFKMEPFVLHTVRPFVMHDIDLSAEAAKTKLDPTDRTHVAKLLRTQIESLITLAAQQWIERFASVPESARPSPMVPLVRLRVAYESKLPLGNLARFGQEFRGRVANPGDILQLQLKRRGRTPAQRSERAVRLDKDMLPAERLERVQLASLVMENVRLQSFEMLNVAKLQESVMGYVEKDERDAIEHFLGSSLEDVVKELERGTLDEAQLQQRLEHISTARRTDAYALEVDHTASQEERAMHDVAQRTRQLSAPSPVRATSPAFSHPVRSPSPSFSPPRPQRRSAARSDASPPVQALPPPLSSRASALDALVKTSRRTTGRNTSRRARARPDESF